MKKWNFCRAAFVSNLWLVSSLAMAQSPWHHHRHGDNGNGQTRTFNFSASDFVSSDQSSATRPKLSPATNIYVNSYLYIEGHLGANWHVTGWGNGISPHHEHLYIYHSDQIYLGFSGFQNPVKTSGSSTGKQEVDLQGRIVIFNESIWKKIFDTDAVPIASLNTIFNGHGISFAPATTGGGMAIDFIRQLSVTPDVGPGVYENAGTITVMRN